MLSEKAYWVILIVVFIGLALSIWFWLIPCGIVEYNLGVNLFTSSIFMLMTIVFLSWLFVFREKMYWKTVEKKVHSTIENNARAIGDLSLLLDPGNGRNLFSPV